MKEATIGEMFSAEISPSLVLLDVAGRRNPVLNGERALAALALANDLQEIGGTGKAVSFVNPSRHAPEAVLLYYHSLHGGRPGRSEIARAAKIIARSEIRYKSDDEGGLGDIHATGTRAIVYPERLARDTQHAVFLVSTRIWYNQNRSVVDFPFGDTHFDLFLADINGRLPEGRVSIAR
ncbi:hypothetical protein [Defluviimonas salinarum]|uniref:Uncharacterized protein n=1 Tax=Defluviimonas salinarum TaxID=2992147 RepID=A0ABT3J841_9RHOB|nr:hypothetical protein [Defluviimonas salinarum]MCW3783595.1 hypothetical protein [Defluviimonas salinarum]